MKYVFYLFLLILFFASGCSQETEFNFDPGDVIAWVDDEPIYSDFFEESYVNYISRTGKKDTPTQRYLHLHSIFDMMLMAKAAEEQGFKDATYQNYLEQSRNRTLRNRFLEYEFLENLDGVDEDQVRVAFYNDQQKVYVSQLFFPNQNQADQYYNRLLNGEDFVDLANKLYALAEYDSLAGYLGEISYFGVDDVFAETAFALDAGEYSKPVRTRQGWVIIRAENWDINPVITETAFEMRQDKYEFFTIQRVYNIEADQWIRDYMNGLNPESILENMELLHYAVQEALPRPENLDTTLRPIEQGDMNYLLNQLDPMTPLVTYSINGERKAFRLNQYMDWLPYLPYEEVIDRIVPSVGRALMWQVFADEAKVKGYHRDPYVEHNVNYSSVIHLASRFDDSLSARPAPPFEEEDLKAAFEQYGMNGIKSSKATFWIKEIENYNEGNELKKGIEKSELSVDRIPGIQEFEMEEISDHFPELESQLRRTLKDQIMIAGTKDKWYIFEVQEREITYYSLNDRRSDVVKKFKPVYNKYLFLKEYRDKYEAKVDTAAFEKLMEYYSAM